MADEFGERVDFQVYRTGPTAQQAARYGWINRATLVIGRKEKVTEFRRSRLREAIARHLEETG